LHVPFEYARITLAFDHVQNGDTVLVSCGVYDEHVRIPNLHCTLASEFLLDGEESFIQETILRPDVETSIDSLSIIELSAPSCQLYLVGFTLQAGQGTPNDWGREGGAILHLNGNLSVRHCVFTENDADFGGAIFCGAESSSLSLEACTFARNSTYQGVVGVYGGEITARGNRFCHNTAIRCPAIYAEYSAVFLDSCVVDSNWNVYQPYAAVEVIYSDTADIRNSVFRANGTDTLNPDVICQVCLAVYETPSLIEACAFEDNFGVSASAFNAAECDVSLINCVFRRNRVSWSGAPITLVQDCRVTMTGCMFDSNSGFRWSAVAAVDELHLENCVFLNNRSDRPDTAGALDIMEAGVVTAVNCSFLGNEPCAIRHPNDFVARRVDVRNNWWGDPSGPYHAGRNPQGLGDAICGDSLLFEPWLTEPPVSADDPHVPQLPTTFTLFNAFPNPFNAQVTIEFAVTRTLPVRVEIFDLLGRHVATLADDVRDLGIHRVTWNASDQPSGIYFARLYSPLSRNTMQVKKLILLK